MRLRLRLYSSLTLLLPAIERGYRQACARGVVLLCKAGHILAQQPLPMAPVYSKHSNSSSAL